jgi:hypothetical protein
MVSHGRRLQCRRCKATFKHEPFFEAHRKSNKCFWRPTKSSKIPCPFCPVTFGNSSSAERHVRRKHVAFVQKGRKLIPATRSELTGGSKLLGRLQKWADKLVPPQLAGLAFRMEDSTPAVEAKAGERTRSTGVKTRSSTAFGGGRGMGRRRREAWAEPLKRVFPCEVCSHASHSYEAAKRHRWTHVKRDMSPFSSSADEEEEEEEEEKEPVRGKKKRPRGGMGDRRRRASLRSETKIHRQRRDLGFRTVRSAHGGLVQRFRYIFPPRIHFMEAAFAHVMPRLAQFLRLMLAANRGMNIKGCVVMNVEMVKINEEAQIEEEMEVPFRGGMEVIRSPSDVIPSMQLWMDRIDVALEEFVKRGSGWTLNDVNYLDVEVYRVPPLQGACHLHTVDYKKGKTRFRDPPTTITVDASAAGGEGERRRRIVLGARCQAEREDGRLRDCFYLAVARAYLGPITFEYAGVRNRFILDKLDCFRAGKKPHRLIRDCDIKAFEKAHAHLKLAINVLYQNEEDEIFPLVASDNNALPDFKVIVLMLRYFASPSSSTSAEEEAAVAAPVGHYAFVEDPASLLAFRAVKGKKEEEEEEKRADKDDDDGGDDDDDDGEEEEEEGKKGERKAKKAPFRTRKAFICWNCFCRYSRQSSYANHIHWCHQRNGQAVRLPHPQEKRAFEQNRGKGLMAAYTVFLDFETYGRPPPDDRHACKCSEAERARADGLAPEPPLEQKEDWALLVDAGLTKAKDSPFKECPHKTRVLNEQHAFAYSMIVVDRFNKVVESESYSGEDAAHVCLARLLALERKYLIDGLKEGGGAPVTAETLAQAGPRPRDPCHPCYLCFKPLDGDVVLDHDHVSGDFLGWAHNACNLHRKEVMKLPVLAHNFSSFDGHIIMREVRKVSWPATPPGT